MFTCFVICFGILSLLCPGHRTHSEKDCAPTLVVGSTWAKCPTRVANSIGRQKTAFNGYESVFYMLSFSFCMLCCWHQRLTMRRRNCSGQTTGHGSSRNEKSSSQWQRRWKWHDFRERWDFDYHDAESKVRNFCTSKNLLISTLWFLLSYGRCIYFSTPAFHWMLQLALDKYNEKKEREMNDITRKTTQLSSMLNRSSLQ